MNFNIKIMSEIEALKFYQNYKNASQYLLISITDKKDELTFNMKNNITVFQTFFGDITKEYPNIDVKPMTFNQALEIKEAVDKATKKGIRNIIVHCYAGISRSGAVGCAIAKYLNGDDTYLWANESILPNKLVYKLMCKAFNLSFSEEEYNYKLNLNQKNLEHKFKELGININEMFL